MGSIRSSHLVVDEDLGTSVGGSHAAPLEAELGLDPGSRILSHHCFPCSGTLQNTQGPEHPSWQSRLQTYRS